MIQTFQVYWNNKEKKMTTLYMLRTPINKEHEWRVVILPRPIDEYHLSMPNLLANIFDCSPVFCDKKEAKAYCKKMVSDLGIEDYTVVILKRNFTIHTFSDMIDNCNPVAHVCGDCGETPSISYSMDKYLWAIRCKNLGCSNGFLTRESRIHKAVNEWNKSQQLKTYRNWLKEKKDV
jgi:hypothetical protein